jgi:hypothetical protein
LSPSSPPSANAPGALSSEVGCVKKPSVAADAAGSDVVEEKSEGMKEVEKVLADPGAVVEGVVVCADAVCANIAATEASIANCEHINGDLRRGLDLFDVPILCVESSKVAASRIRWCYGEIG